ncbi:enoyl-CoA hydratase/isomerase family protein [Pseudomonas fluorescens]|nr:enoyl-CoA hydratase/isomerase family protein [Pseudomonas fluorescens]
MSLVEFSFDNDRGIATINFNRPQSMNALDIPMARAVNDAVAGLAALQGLRCVVLRGAGRAFIAGGDLTAFAADFEQAGAVLDELLDQLNPAVIGLQGLGVPVLASVHGAVAGAGVSLMCACDLVIAAQDTRFVFAYGRIATSPDCGGSWLLPHLIGLRKATEFMFLGDTWDAETAHRAGLVNKVVPIDQLESETDVIAHRLATGPTLAFRAFKKLASNTYSHSLAEQVELERAEFRALVSTRDFREGVSTFLEKRTPHFEGK